MAAEKIAAEKRTEFGKGAARRIRRDNKIPAVVYGQFYGFTKGCPSSARLVVEQMRR